MVVRDVVLVVEPLAGLDGQQHVVRVAAGRDVQAVGVQVRVLVGVVGQLHPQGVPGSNLQGRTRVGLLVGDGLHHLRADGDRGVGHAQHGGQLPVDTRPHRRLEETGGGVGGQSTDIEGRGRRATADPVHPGHRAQVDRRLQLRRPIGHPAAGGQDAGPDRGCRADEQVPAGEATVLAGRGHDAASLVKVTERVVLASPSAQTKVKVCSAESHGKTMVEPTPGAGPAGI